jgi:hypothetical protein
VSQTYYRVREMEKDPACCRVNLLFSDYMELGEAKLHVNAVKKDRYAAIVDLENPSHLKKWRRCSRLTRIPVVFCGGPQREGVGKPREQEV